MPAGKSCNIVLHRCAQLNVNLLNWCEEKQRAELESLRIEEGDGETIADIYPALHLRFGQQDARGG